MALCLGRGVLVAPEVTDAHLLVNFLNGMRDPLQRYLYDLDVTGNLSAGRDVEQLLPDRYELDQRVIRFVSIEQANLNAWRVRLCEVFDNGAPGFIDVYEFEAVDPDHPFGTEWTFDSVDGALRFARDVLRTSQGRYVNQGLIQDEYKDRYHPEW